MYAVAAVLFCGQSFASQDDLLKKAKWVMGSCAEVRLSSGAGTAYFAGFNSGRPCGYAVEVSGRGYGGPVNLLVGLDTALKIKDFAVLSHSETQGFSDAVFGDGFKKKVKGLGDGELRIRTASAGGNVDAVSGATYTSKAVLSGLQSAITKVKAALSGSGRNQSKKVKK